MKNTLYDFVEIEENYSSYENPEEIIHICKRLNNPKRDFLFVNSIQGKHVPVKPSTVINLFESLCMQVLNGIDSKEKIAVIGFAETATAIGSFIAKNIPNCVYYAQTTRETYDSAEILVKFSEEHSHAPTQLIYGNKEQLKCCDRIIFVEDEISTGQTILNFVKKLRDIGITSKFSVASILNWQDDRRLSKFVKEGIDIFYLVKGKLKDTNAKVVLTEEFFGVKVDSILPKNKIKTYYSKNSSMNERLGVNPQRLSDKDILEYLYNECEFESPKKQEKVLVLGTEEFMNKPLMFAYRMECLYPNKDIYFHATTRSPITTSSEEGYILNSRYEVASVYSDTRNTFVYNLKKYDRIFVVTDGFLRADFIFSITQAFLAAGNECEIEFVSFNGGTI